MAILDKPQLMSISAMRWYRELQRLVRSGLTSLTGYSAFIPSQILHAPADLRTADRLLAEEFYNGRYFLGNVLVETKSKSPFLVKAAPVCWHVALHEFEWLRHLAGKNDILSANHARVLVRDWLEHGDQVDQSIAWDISVTARRLICMLYHSDVILNGATHEFYSLYMRGIGTHLRFLKRYGPTADNGLPKLLAYLALSQASVCCTIRGKPFAFADVKLARELETQIFPDGGHLSRSPAVIMDILSLLLPYRQACVAAGREPSQALTGAIERMLPALRTFRLGDGNMARFNGTGVTEHDLLSTLLRHDESMGLPLLHARQSAFQRLVSGDAVIVQDVGNPPVGELSVDAHAGCLSFEMTSQEDSLIVNCGRPSVIPDGSGSVWRSTAAHSTANLYDTSSCRFENRGNEKRQVYGQILTTNIGAESNREDSDTSTTVSAWHLGYAKRFGIRHQRSLTLDENGFRLTGRDWFSTPYKEDLRSSKRDAVTLRFHLHPDVRVLVLPSVDNRCILETRSHQRWLFSCLEVTPKIEESILFANASGTRKTHQIILRFDAGKTPDVNWVLKRTT